MLNTHPGAFIFMGNGDSASLHNSGYNFNDEAIATRRLLLGTPGRNIVTPSRLIAELTGGLKGVCSKWQQAHGRDCGPAQAPPLGGRPEGRTAVRE